MTYRGRFAPSPTGFLHMGSLVSALASFLDAKAYQGEWLVRMEDIDPPREEIGAATAIVQSLKAHHLMMKSDVVYQSQGSDRYVQAMKQLWEKQSVYVCRCTNKQVKSLWQKGLRCSCRNQSTFPWHDDILEEIDAMEGTIRLRVDQDRDSHIHFHDRYYGPMFQCVATAVGDFVLRRRDGLFAYQLAVVVDDAWQGITHIVRGADLLEVTHRQIYLQKKLGLPTPYYRHVPLVYDAMGNKLSKQHFAPVLDDKKALSNLHTACRHLGITGVKSSQCEELLQHAVAEWVR